MFNNIIKVHNNYTIETRNKQGEILQKKTIYNEANGGLFVAQNATGGASVPLVIYYRPFKKTAEGETETEASEEIYTTVTVNMSRITNSENVGYGTSIEYGGSVDFYPSDKFTGNITHLAMGLYIKRNEKGEVIEKRHWSEAGGAGIEKTAEVSLHITIHLYITVNKPSLEKVYSKELSSVLPTNSSAFPRPLPSSFRLSSFDLSLLSGIEYLKKEIPTNISLPFTIVTDEEAGTATAKNTSLIEEGSHAGSFFISGDTNGASVYNMGAVRTIVAGDIGAMSLGGSFTGEQNWVYIPAVTLTGQKLYDMVNSEQDDFYFFCSKPKDSSYVGVVINGNIDNTLTFRDPDDMSRVSFGNVSMSTNEYDTHPITYYHDTSEGGYYAHYLFDDGVYWEPPSGSSTSPNCVYISTSTPPTNMYLGGNIGARVEYKQNGQWQTLIGGTNYAVSYAHEVDGQVEGYRVLVSAPNMTEHFYTNFYERETVPFKTYDRNIICIGTGEKGSNGDFGTAGIHITKAEALRMYNSLASDQKTIGYNIGIAVRPGGFYKSSFTLAFLNYSITATG